MIRGILYSWVPWIYNKVIEVMYSTKRITIAAYNEAYVEKEWIFLKNNSIPVSSRVFTNIANIGIKWRCKVNPPRFIDPTKEIIDFKHVSYLGLTVNIPGYDTMDLTNWINEIEWSGNFEPSPADIFILWCCDTGVSYFHRLSDAQIEIITDMGETVTKGLNEYIHTTYSTNV
jgi:hypothetical protein